MGHVVFFFTCSSARPDVVCFIFCLGLFEHTSIYIYAVDILVLLAYAFYLYTVLRFDREYYGILIVVEIIEM